MYINIHKHTSLLYFTKPLFVNVPCKRMYKRDDVTSSHDLKPIKITRAFSLIQ